MEKCRECQAEVSLQARACPKCGCPNPSKPNKDAWGWEYKSPLMIAGLPLIHISFKYRFNKFGFMPTVANGIIAIGQFGVGIITIAQFGVGVFSVAQFAVAGFAIAQFAVACSLIAQFGLFLHKGIGPGVTSMAEFFHLLVK